MRVRTVVAAATAGVTAVLLTACEGQPGAAAIVDGEVISQSYVATAQSDLVEQFPGVGPQIVVQMLVLAPFVHGVSADQGAALSMQDVRDSVTVNVGPEAADQLGDEAFEVLRADLALQQLFAENDQDAVITELQSRFAAAEIQVNPRYGRFSAEAGGIEAIQLDWIRYVE
ncbi:hypothetical protein [Cellulomonas bogoriensis]|uniref:hypothetical protein n=1 Tax=Cellulomonas bogoriensis TaxID=301388 RepID=UPI0012EC551F|nr:hypothetical protein [Cellulomonas bogoriensis]